MTTNAQTAGKSSTTAPDYAVFTQISDNVPLVRIGAAWKHNKGEGVSVRLDALPVNGTLVLFPPREEAAA